MLKIIRVKIFHVVKFSQSRSIREIFLTVDNCNMDKRLKSSWGLSTTRYQESQGSLTVVVNRTFNLGSVNLRASLFTDHRRVILFLVCYFLRLVSTAKLF